MTDDVYLVDNNVLSRLSRSQRAGRFLRERCVITEEVLHEARGFADEISGIQVRDVTVVVLEHLKHVMAELPPGDTSLVDLYANKGTADPVLVATALVMMDEEAQTLFASKTVIVTDDKAVAQMAGQLGVECLSCIAFVALVGS